MKFTLFIFCFVITVSCFSNTSYLDFIKNEGQIANAEGIVQDEILFKTSVDKADLYLLKNKIIFITKEKYAVETKESLLERKKGNIEYAEQLELQMKHYRFELEFNNTNPDVKINGENKCSNYSNYYLGHCKNGIMNVPHFKSVYYKNIYPNIDLKFYSNSKGLKFDFIVHPGGDPNQINYSYTDVTGIEKDTEGNLDIYSPLLNFSEEAPYSYYMDETNEVEVESNFNLSENNHISFKLNNYPKEKTLIIDPTLDMIWSTYFDIGGSSTWDNVSFNSTGDFYAACYHYSSLVDVLDAGGFYQSTDAGGTTDLAIIKFSNTGTQLWTTYYGGTGNEYLICNTTAVDGNDNLYVGGETSSTTTFPLQNAGGYYDGTTSSTCGFLLKFDNNCNRLWATFIGASGSRVRGITTSSTNDVYIVGSCYSSAGLPVQSQGGGCYYQSVHGGGSDGYIMRFNSSTTKLWCTYFGGNCYVNFIDIHIDPTNDNLYCVGELSGWSAPSSYPPLVNPGGGAYFDNTVNGKQDLFIARFNSSRALTWSTIYGGQYNDNFNGDCGSIDTDSDGNFYFCGKTMSDNLPLQNPGGGAYYQSSIGGTGVGDSYNDGFILKFNSSGVRQWATYYGGSSSEEIRKLKIDNNDNVWIAGYTNSTNLPLMTATDHYNQTSGGGTDAFIGRFTQSGVREWASCLGGSGSETCRPFEIYEPDASTVELFMVDYTNSADFPTVDPGGAYYIGARPTSTSAYITKFTYATCGLPIPVGMWGGAYDSNWNDCRNWGAGRIPDATVDVTIPAGCPNYPALTGNLSVNSSAGTYDCKSLNIQTGGSITNTSSLSVYGTMTVAGSYTSTYNSSNSQRIYSGGTVSVTGTMTLGNSANYYTDLRVENGGSLSISGSGHVIVGDQFNVYSGGTFSISGGTLDANSGGGGSGYSATYPSKFYIEAGASGGATGGTITVCGRPTASGYYAVDIREPNWDFSTSATLEIKHGLYATHYNSDIYTVSGVLLGRLNINKAGNVVYARSTLDIRYYTYVYANAEFNSNSQTIYTYSIVYDYGKVNMNGGTWYHNYNSSDSWRVYSGGELEVNSGTMNIGRAANDYYTDINVYSGGLLDINGGTISIADECEAGGTIDIATGTLQVGTYYNNNGGSSDAKFDLASTGTLNMASGTLEIKKCYSSAYPGLRINTGSSVNVTGGTVLFRNAGSYYYTIYATFGNKTFNDITINMTSGTYTTHLYTNSVYTRGDIYIQSGDFYANSYDINLQGNWINNDNFVAGTGEVIFYGTNAQNIQGTQNTTFYDLTLNKSSNNVTLQNNTFVTHNLNLTSGLLNTTTSELLTMNDNSTSSNASDASFVNGPMKKVGNDAFEFPVGKNTSGNIWAPIAISAPSLTTDAFTIEYFFTDPGNFFWNSAYMTNLHHVSSIEYWEVVRSSGSSSPALTLHWKNAQRSDILNLSETKVAHWNTSTYKWENMGGTATGAVSPSTGTGYITSTITFPNYSPVTFGSLTSTNTLPIELLKFDATCRGDHIELTWTTAVEINNNYFTLEKSTDGINYNQIAYVTGAGTSNELTEYIEYDYQPEPEITYYRLRQTDFNGEETVSLPISVNCEQSPDKFEAELIKDGDNSYNLIVSGCSEEEFSFYITDQLGRKLYSVKQYENNNLSTFTLPDCRSAIYNMVVTCGDKVITKKFFNLNR